ncbi:MAG: hypothetical protein ACI8SI_000592 [Congregibacter sp.]|jgi:hypothetical protein
MARAELLSLSSEYSARAGSCIDRILALIFATVAASFVAAPRLTSAQFAIANLLYISAAALSGYWLQQFWIALSNYAFTAAFAPPGGAEIATFDNSFATPKL